MVVRALPSGVSNVKYLTFDTPNTKKPLSWGVLNTKIFYMSEHYYLKYRSIRTTIVKVLLFFYSLFSLFSHHFIPFFFLFSLILPQTFLSTHIFFFHSFFFSLLLLFSLPLNLAAPPPQPNADLCCCGFFFFAMICWVGSTVGGLKW